MIDLRLGDCLTVLRSLESESVHCVVTSPPYWGLRSYQTEPQIWANGHEPCVEHQWITETRNGQSGGKSDKQDSNRGSRFNNLQVDTCSICGAWRGELGLEPTPELFCAHLVEIFRECRRVLRDDGTLWLNLGDSYASGGENRNGKNSKTLNNGRADFDCRKANHGIKREISTGLKPKDLVGIPWMVAFALRADGWYLRSDIIWAKPNPMPESVTDRPTKAHEYIFMLSKSRQYYYDADAVREPHARLWDETNGGSWAHTSRQPKESKAGNHSGSYPVPNPAGRNRRTVWTVATHPFKGAHFATFPPKLIEPCILAGTSARGVCPKCGAPWERVIERGKKIAICARGQYDWHTDAPHDGFVKDGSYQGKPGMAYENKTTGWRPTCSCDAGEPVPAVVLDPFNGAGTTGVVAVTHGRNYIGIDLKSEYIEMARERIEKVQPALVTV